MSQGEWEGQPRDECYNEQVIETLSKDPRHFRAPGGESQDDVRTRVVSFVNDYIVSSDDSTVAVFAHGVVIRCFLDYVMQSQTTNWWMHTVDNTAICKFVHDDKRGWYLDTWNHTQHLDADL
eukprot:TRINITY_DN2668_c0_g1_i1.p1 TRINITY_DN2668_c0_g1~~TRINITY_DN2668_c0_g1_i1.p1  ORF type:complete len:122 (-),score=16.11 TRINITY_DN2668_c0_g1_i1:103-468(-)